MDHFKLECTNQIFPGSECYFPICLLPALSLVMSFCGTFNADCKKI